MQPNSNDIQTFLHNLDWTYNVLVKYKMSTVNMLYLIFSNDLPSWLHFKKQTEKLTHISLLSDEFKQPSLGLNSNTLKGQEPLESSFR